MVKYLSILLFFLGSLLYGQSTYYVDTSGEDIAGRDGSMGEEWASLSYACSRVTSGVIYVNSGNYSDGNRCNRSPNVTILGNSASPPNITVTYVGSTYSGYIYDYSATNTNGNSSISYINFEGNNLSSMRCMYIENRNNVVIHDCTIENFLVGGIYFESEDGWLAEPSSYITGCSVYNCTIRNCSDRQYTAEGIIRATACHELMVYNCTFDGRGRNLGRNGNTLTLTFLRGCKFYNNTFYKNDNENGEWNFYVELFHARGGVEFYGNKFIGAATLNVSSGPGQGCFIDAGFGYTYSLSIHDNNFRTSTSSQLAGPDGGKPHIAIDIESNLEYVEIYRNYIRSYGTGIGMVTSTISQVYDQNHVYINTNIIANIGYTGYTYTYGIYINDEGNDQTDVKDNIHVDNNTITGGSGYNYQGMVWHMRGNITNSSARNNIIYDFDNRAIYISRQTDAGQTLNLTDCDFTYNNFYSNGSNGVSRSSVTSETSCDFTTGNITTDPLFSSPTPPFNFILQTGSGAIHTGTYIGSPVIYDYVGNSWLNPPSMGVFEATVGDYLPVLTTTAISLITNTSASSGGVITSDGGEAVTARGVCYGTATAPTIAGTKTSNGTGTGTFTSSITGLDAGTDYYVRAYATNTAGTAYGNERVFQTNPDGGVKTVGEIGHLGQWIKHLGKHLYK